MLSIKRNIISINNVVVVIAVVTLISISDVVFLVMSFPIRTTITTTIYQRQQQCRYNFTADYNNFFLQQLNHKKNTFCFHLYSVQPPNNSNNNNDNNDPWWKDKSWNWSSNLVEDTSSLSSARKTTTSKQQIKNTQSLSKEQINNEIDYIEKQVLASAKAKMDIDRIIKALDRKTTTTTTSSSSTSTPFGNSVLSTSDDTIRNNDTNNTWNISIAGATVVSIVSYLLVHNIILSIILFVVVFVYSIDDNNNNNDTTMITGSITRLLGRSTLQTVDIVEPKIRALVRAVLTEEEEIIVLTNKIQLLESELIELRQYKYNQEKINTIKSDYTVKYLKSLAKNNNLITTGSKTDLLYRLLEANVINTNEVDILS